MPNIDSHIDNTQQQRPPINNYHMAQTLQAAINKVKSKLHLGANTYVSDIPFNQVRRTNQARSNAVWQLRRNPLPPLKHFNDVDNNTSLYIQEAKRAKRSHLHVGNCSEQSYLLALYLWKEHANIVERVEIVTYADHVFVLINRPENSNIADPTSWGENTWYADPWCNTVKKLVMPEALAIDIETEAARQTTIMENAGVHAPWRLVEPGDCLIFNSLMSIKPIAHPYPTHRHFTDYCQSIIDGKTSIMEAKNTLKNSRVKINQSLSAKGLNPLCMAIKNKHTDLLNLLLARGADPLYRSSKKQLSPLEYAVSLDDDTSFSRMWSHIVNNRSIHHYTYENITQNIQQLLIRAIRDRRPKMALAIIEAARAKMNNPELLTQAWHSMLNQGYTRVAQAFLEHPVTNKQYFLSRCQLIPIYHNRDTSLLGYLLEQGANPFARRNNYQPSLIQMAHQKNDIALMSKVLSCYLNNSNKNQQTTPQQYILEIQQLLICSIKEGRTEMASIIIEKARGYINNPKLLTQAWQNMLYRGYFDVIKKFLEHPATNPTFFLDDCQLIPLYKLGHHDVLYYLLERGANPFIRERNHQKSLIQWAYQKEDITLFKKILACIHRNSDTYSQPGIQQIHLNINAFYQRAKISKQPQFVDACETYFNRGKHNQDSAQVKVGFFKLKTAPKPKNKNDANALLNSMPKEPLSKIYNHI